MWCRGARPAALEVVQSTLQTSFTLPRTFHGTIFSHLDPSSIPKSTKRIPGPSSRSIPTYYYLALTSHQAHTGPPCPALFHPILSFFVLLRPTLPNSLHLPLACSAPPIRCQCNPSEPDPFLPSNTFQPFPTPICGRATARQLPNLKLLACARSPILISSAKCASGGLTLVCAPRSAAMQRNAPLFLAIQCHPCQCI